MGEGVSEFVIKASNAHLSEVRVHPLQRKVVDPTSRAKPRAIQREDFKNRAATTSPTARSGQLCSVNQTPAAANNTPRFDMTSFREHSKYFACSHRASATAGAVADAEGWPQEPAYRTGHHAGKRCATGNVCQSCLEQDPTAECGDDDPCQCRGAAESEIFWSRSVNSKTKHSRRTPTIYLSPFYNTRDGCRGVASIDAAEIMQLLLGNSSCVVHRCRVRRVSDIGSRLAT